MPEVVVVLKCTKCKAKREVSKDDQTARDFGHYCTCGNIVPMLVHQVKTKREVDRG